MWFLLISLDWHPHCCRLLITKLFLWAIDLCGKHCHAELSAGAAHLLILTTLVSDSRPGKEQQVHVDQKVNMLHDGDFQSASSALNAKTDSQEQKTETELLEVISNNSWRSTNLEKMGKLLEVRRRRTSIIFFWFWVPVNVFARSAMNFPTTEKTNMPCFRNLMYHATCSLFWSTLDFCSCAAHLETPAFSFNECAVPAKLPTEWCVSHKALNLWSNVDIGNFGSPSMRGTDKKTRHLAASTNNRGTTVFTKSTTGFWELRRTRTNKRPRKQGELGALSARKMTDYWVLWTSAMECPLAAHWLFFETKNDLATSLTLIFPTVTQQTVGDVVGLLFSTHSCSYLFNPCENQTQWRRHKRNTADASQPNLQNRCDETELQPRHFHPPC